MLLANKVALITNAAGRSGLGFGTARRLAQHGARVAILDRWHAEPEAAAADSRPQHVGIAANVTDANVVQSEMRKGVDDQPWSLRHGNVGALG